MGGAVSRSVPLLRQRFRLKRACASKVPLSFAAKVPLSFAAKVPLSFAAKVPLSFAAKVPLCFAALLEHHNHLGGS